VGITEAVKIDEVFRVIRTDTIEDSDEYIPPMDKGNMN
jgi:hypothetical protein